MECKTQIIKDWTPWVNALRPKTLTASVAPVMIGSFYALANQGYIDWSLSASALAAAILIQTGTNLINDAVDFERGADNQERVGPVRLVQAGMLSAKQVYRLGISAFVLALAAAIPLIIKGGVVFMIILILSCLCGYMYTAGPLPLAYRAGWSDIAVVLFFGIILTTSVAFVQMLTIQTGMIIAGLQIGLLAAVMLAINNLRDIDGDAKAKKNTFAVKWGKTAARCEITFFALMPYILGLCWTLMGLAGAACAPLASLPLAIKLVKDVWRENPGPAYNKYLAQGGLLQLLFGLLFCIGIYALN